MSSDRCFFALFLIIHAFLISALLPGGGFIVLLLIIDVSIISSYGVNCKGKPTVEVCRIRSPYQYYKAVRKISKR